METPDLPGESTVLKELRRRKNERLKTSIQFGTGQNPDAYAKTRNSANKLGVPIDVAERNPDQINKLATESEILEKLRDSHAARRMFQNPDTAAIAHDDVDGLVKAERTAKALAAGGVRATLGISESIWRTPEAIGRISDAINQGLGINKLSGYLKEKGAPDWLVGTQNPLLNIMTKGVDVGDQHFAGTSDIADMVNKSQDILGEEFDTFRRINEKGHAADIAFDEALKGNFNQLADVLTDPEAWAGFIGQAAPSLYMAYKSGGSIPFIAWLEGMEVANDAAEFEKMTGQSIDPVAFTQATAQVALLNSFLEKFSLDRVFGSYGKGVLSSTIKSAVTEGGTEMLQEFNTNVAKYLAYNPDQNLSEGVLGAGMGGFGAGSFGGAASAMGRASGPNSEFARNIGKAQKAFDDAERMTAAVEAVQELKTNERDKSAVKSFLDDALGAEQEVYIPASDAQAFFQSHPEIMKDLPDEVAESIQESMWMNNDVAMDKSDYLTYLSKYHEELSESLRNDMDGMNIVEANEWIEEGETQFEAEAERILEQQEMSEESEVSANRVAQAIKDQVLRTGRFTEETAERYARLHRASAVAISERTGMTPEQVYEKLGLRIQGAPIVGEEVMGQPLSEIMMDDIQFTTEDGDVVTVQMTAEQAVNEVESRIEALNRLKGCLGG